MTKLEISQLPERYQEFEETVIDTFRVSQRVLEPVLIIEHQNDHYEAVLHGERIIRGEIVRIESQSIFYNWVFDGEMIRPLPSDITQSLQKTFKPFTLNHLSYPDVLKILRLDQSWIKVEFIDDILIPANNPAINISATPKILGLQANLYEYQASGVAWMQKTLSYTGGLILADEMGLGKTVQIISLLLLIQPTEDSPALIICPTSLIANWKTEIFRFAPTLSLLIHQGPNRAGIAHGLKKAQIVIATYGTAVNDISLFNSLNWSWVICDEAQALKNPDSSRRKHMAQIPRQRTIAVTGTPIENTLLDLWSLADFTIPGILGTKDEFEAKYPDDSESAVVLNTLMQPIVLRRTVTDVAGDLPDRLNIDLPIELGHKLAAEYERIRKETIEEYEMAGALVATGRLQMFCAHPHLITKNVTQPDWEGTADFVNNKTQTILTPKIEIAVNLIREAFLNNKKVLVFSLFNRCGDLIKSSFDNKPHIFWKNINGSTPQEDRQTIIDNYSRHPGNACLVLNPRAAGAGLNITAATVVIHFTQVWNPALEAQASARAHRRGQINPVTIYRLYYEDTVEAVMIDRSSWKRELGNDAIPISTRDKTDIRRALEVSPEKKHV